MTLQQFRRQNMTRPPVRSNLFRLGLFRIGMGDRTNAPWARSFAASITMVVGLMASYSTALGQSAQAHTVESVAAAELHATPVLLSQTSAALPQAIPTAQGREPQVANGIYLFGDTTTPGQLGHEYMVLQVEGSTVTGGFYEPGHTFSCFSGSITSQALSLRVQDRQRPDSGFYQVPIYLDNQFSTSRFVLPYENTLGLQGTHRIDGTEPESQRVLNVCRTSQSLNQQFEPVYSFISPGSIVTMAPSVR